VDYVVGSLQGVNFISVSTLFLATEECEVQFNDSGHWIRIHAGPPYFEFYKQIYKITVRRVTTNGTLEVWAEGYKTR
jgi:hypothetical protein